jgi:hypothetical protein
MYGMARYWHNKSVLPRLRSLTQKGEASPAGRGQMEEEATKRAKPLLMQGV